MLPKVDPRTMKLPTLVMLLFPLALAEAAESYRFRVTLDDRDIGRHEFHIDRGLPGTERVRIDADFDVRILRIPVYRYRHSNEEVWRDGCLRELQSFTDDNGDRSRVQARELDGDLAINRNGESVSYRADCVRSFAYWNRDFVTSRQLLNAQTGRLVEVDIQPLGSAPDIDGLDAADLEGYLIRSVDDSLRISVWYQRDSGRWTALETVLENDRVLRYLPQQVSSS